MGRRLYISEEAQRERAFLVGVRYRNQNQWEVEESLDELEALSGTAGAEVVGRTIFHENNYHAATFIGKGKAEQLAAQVSDGKITTLVFDDDLTPAQGRNLSQLTQAKIIDRTQVILHIFARHARSKAGRLQVEFAQLQYLLPRLRRRWTHLERQQGGIGLRGPGEKQLELDRRRIEERLHRIRQELARLIKHRAQLRSGRQRHGWALIALVGYTNAGKSTLMNALTNADAVVEDELFSTLDPLTRRLKLPNNQMALLTDTVGFIRKLPHHLIEAFKATLEEVVEADVLLHVIDAAHPAVEHQIESVHEVLREIGVHEKPTLHVLNKMDRPEAGLRAGWLKSRFERVVTISALRREGLEELLDELADMLRARNVDGVFRVPLRDGKSLAQIRGLGKVYSEEFTPDGHVIIRASVPIRLRDQLREFVISPEPALKNK